MKMVIIGVTMIGLGALIILMGLRSDTHKACISYDQHVKRIEDCKKISDEKSEIINEQNSLINELLSKERGNYLIQSQNENVQFFNLILADGIHCGLVGV